MDDGRPIEEDTHKDETYYSMPWNMHWQMSGYTTRSSRQSWRRDETAQGAKLQRIYIRSCAYDYNRGSLSGSADWKGRNCIGCAAGGLGLEKQPWERVKIIRGAAWYDCGYAVRQQQATNHARAKRELRI
jgi:hypothetical protein